MSETLPGYGTGAVPLISRLRLKNYKSIAQCDVRFEPLTILVGQNGSGKSNFLDALEFLCRAVATSPNQALDERGGLESVLRQVPETCDSFSIEVEVSVPWWPASPEVTATYEIEIGRAQDNKRGITVLRESGTLNGPDGTATFSSSNGRAELSPTEDGPWIPRGRITIAGGIERAVEAEALRVPGKGGVLVLLGADDDCPAEYGPLLLARAKAARRDRKVSVVLANREFDAWFLAAAPSLAGKFGFPAEFVRPLDPESRRDCKGLLTKARPKGQPYKETVDQAPLASALT